MNKTKQRWVIKAGSSLLSGGDSGINKVFIENLVSQVSYLLSKDIEVILVSSGAVAKGMHELNLKKRPSSIHLLQASAAIGQMGLINAYQEEFNKFDLKAAQILISHDDINNRNRYLNARRSIETLLELKVVPIVNENDTVATEEISFGDNDTLAGSLVGLVTANRLVMLTDQVGVCTGDPQNDPLAELIEEIDLEDKNLDLSKQLAGSSGALGRGGMRTKLDAAKKALNSGAISWVVDGRKKRILESIWLEEPAGTKIFGLRSKLQSRKSWIDSLGLSLGKIIIDKGAVKSITENGSSLLAAGITSTEGDFGRGSLIVCYDEQDQEIAKGLSNFNSNEIEKIKGLHSKEFRTILGYTSDEEVIHRNNFVLSERFT
jgi:glutamate 5-kinase|tara:strand:+ start:6282 stop:7409 length:1128 start_codon:yes stop_codon:yes gene_type:complete